MAVNFLISIGKCAKAWSLKLDAGLGADPMCYGQRQNVWVRKRIRSIHDRAHNEYFRMCYFPEKKIA